MVIGGGIKGFPATQWGLKRVLMKIQMWVLMVGRVVGGIMVYPARPDAEDCQHYMWVGLCKFNHPLKRRTQYLKPAKDNEDYSERPAKTECKCYMTSGGCKHGNSCRFRHIRLKPLTTQALEFNFLGLPIRRASFFSGLLHTEEMSIYTRHYYIIYIHIYFYI